MRRKRRRLKDNTACGDRVTPEQPPPRRLSLHNSGTAKGDEMKKELSSSKEKILTREDVINPDYDYWARMDKWDRSEAVYLIRGLQPPMKLVAKHSLFRAKWKEQLEKYQYHLRSGDIRKIELWRWSHLAILHRKILSGVLYPDELKGFDDTFGIFMRRFEEKGGDGVLPLEVVKWAKSKHLPLPRALVKKVKKYHPERADAPVEVNPAKGAVNLLSGKERTELGRLKIEKAKWDQSIRAAVEATLLCKGKKLSHKELEDKLFKYNLPDTTIDGIWVALRDKGLTQPAGRPSKKNPQNMPKPD